MIVLVAKYYVKPGAADRVAAALERMAPLVKEHEPGCAMYQVSRSTDRPDLFMLYEHYVDEAAFHAHRVTPHFKHIIEDTIAPLLDKRERELYELFIS